MVVEPTLRLLQTGIHSYYLHFLFSTLSRSLYPRMAVSAQLAQEWLGDDYEDEDVVYLDQEEQDYDEEDEEDYGPGVTIFRAPPSPEPEPTTDLAEQAYTDPLALVNAWEGALQDYKVGCCLAVDNPGHKCPDCFSFARHVYRTVTRISSYRQRKRLAPSHRKKSRLPCASPLASVPDQAVLLMLRLTAGTDRRPLKRRLQSSYRRRRRRPQSWSNKSRVKPSKSRTSPTLANRRRRSNKEKEEASNRSKRRNLKMKKRKEEKELSGENGNG